MSHDSFGFAKSRQQRLKAQQEKASRQNKSLPVVYCIVCNSKIENRYENYFCAVECFKKYNVTSKNAESKKYISKKYERETVSFEPQPFTSKKSDTYNRYPNVTSSDFEYRNEKYVKKSI